MMSAIATHATALSGASFPSAVDTHWETVTCLLWNQCEHVSEECELVYEISWIPELGAWRRLIIVKRLKVEGFLILD
jgi:hypothetical protein